MRKKFMAYYPPTQGEITDIWSQGVIVLDTNTLLNFFRYRSKTRNEFLGVLDKLENQLWLPYQVGLEFQKQRLAVIHDTTEVFANINDAVEKSKNDIIKSVDKFKHHPTLNREEIKKEVEQFWKSLSDRLMVQKKEHANRMIVEGEAEAITERITKLFAERVGDGFDKDEMINIYDEGSSRYEKLIPPGYKDKDKSGENKYGDFIIWKEILKYAEAEKTHMIFVTDDAKEDWWRIEKGKTLGPRVELVEEYNEASEKRIHFYPPLEFLKYAKNITHSEISPESLDEVQKVSLSENESTVDLEVLKESLERELENRLRLLDDAMFLQHDRSPTTGLVEKIDNITKEEKNLEHYIDHLVDNLELLQGRSRGRVDDDEFVWSAAKLETVELQVQGLQKELTDLRNRKKELTDKLRKNDFASIERVRFRKRQVDRTKRRLEAVNAELENNQN